MTYRENTRMDKNDIPLYRLLRAAEARRRQAERERVPWPWPLLWLWFVLVVGWAIIVWG